MLSAYKINELFLFCNNKRIEEDNDEQLTHDLDWNVQTIPVSAHATQKKFRSRLTKVITIQRKIFEPC
jgi:sulfur relay (sulfurtransferase) DsrC/TusE family protein